MTNLTDKWKKGELPEGDYYIERRNGYIPYDNIDSKGVWRNSIDEDIVEVLAPVPSYEEYTKLKEELKDYEYQHKQDGICYDDIFCKLELARKENRQLKELLKECRGEISPYKDFISGKKHLKV